MSLVNSILSYVHIGSVIQFIFGEVVFIVLEKVKGDLVFYYNRGTCVAQSVRCLLSPQVMVAGS